MGKRIKTHATDNPITAKAALKKQHLIFTLILVVFTALLYYNTIFNYFSLDDNYINTSNEQSVQGFKALPEIFTTLYSDNGEQAYGYRALTRATFAVEYQFTANSSYNPYISHFINLMLYILAALVLFKVLNRLFRNYNPWFAFLVVAVFIAHPTHTEVVASLKNRDMLLHFLFSFLAIWQFIRWIDLDKTRHLIVGLVYFLLALMSKETAIVQLAIFPLVLYFFTDIKRNKLLVFVGVSAAVLVLFFGARMLFLPATNRVYDLMENPLVFETSFLKRIATGFYGLGFYLKLLIFPFPLLYYYGYNMIPVVGFSNIWVILSAIAYVGFLVVALMNLKEKKFISFALLFFLIHMSMYANFVKPVPGIVADRFVFFSSLAFAMVLIWLLFGLLKVRIAQEKLPTGKTAGIVLTVLLFLIPYGYYVHQRNKVWKSTYSLYKHDMKWLDNSVKANNLYASEMIRQVNVELAKPVNPYKFVLQPILLAEKHYQRAIEIDSSHVASLNSVGIINSRIHGNQALLRERSFLKQGKLEEAEKARKESEVYFLKALDYFNRALKFDSNNGSSYYNVGNLYEIMQQYDSAALYYQKEINTDGPMPMSLSRLANIHYQSGDIPLAIQENETLKKLFPDNYLPYVNIGNYAIRENDTARMLTNFAQAAKLGGGAGVINFLVSYYQSVGDQEQASYYRNMAIDAERKLNRK